MQKEIERIIAGKGNNAIEAMAEKDSRFLEGRYMHCSSRELRQAIRKLHEQNHVFADKILVVKTRRHGSIIIGIREERLRSRLPGYCKVINTRGEYKIETGENGRSLFSVLGAQIKARRLTESTAIIDAIKARKV